MGLIRSFVTLCFACVVVKAIEEGKKKVDKLEAIDERTERMQRDIEDLKRNLEKR